MIVDSTPGQHRTAYLKEALECTPIGVVICNKWLRVVFVNGAACMITGMKRDEAVGIRLNKVFGSPIVYSFLENARAMEGKHYFDLFSSIENENKTIELRVIASSIRDAKGAFGGTVIFLDTLSNIKELSRDIIRTERLSAIKEAAISINHEINNPLCSILGNTQLLLMKKDNLDPVVVEKLEKIESDISRIHDIAEKLTKISKPVIREYVGDTRMIDIDKSSI